MLKSVTHLSAKHHLSSTKCFCRSLSCLPLDRDIAQKTLCSAPIRFSRRQASSIKGTDSKFPFADSFGLSCGTSYSSAQIIAGLQPLITSKRLDTISKVIHGRCFSILPIVEGLHDMGNLGAVCRSADALGMGAVHCINADKQRYRARKQRNSAGAEKWMDIRYTQQPHQPSITVQHVEANDQQRLPALHCTTHSDRQAG